jgi:hypothetical protein
VSVHRRPINDCKTLHDDSIMQMCVHHIYLVAPGLVVVVHDGGAKAPRRVDPRAGDRDGRQVDHEHGEPDWQRRQNLITISLIRTQATHQHEGALAITVTHSRELDPFPYRNVGVASVALGVAEKTVYTRTKVPMISAARPVPVENPAATSLSPPPYRT